MSDNRANEIGETILKTRVEAGNAIQCQGALASIAYHQSKHHCWKLFEKQLLLMRRITTEALF